MATHVGLERHLPRRVAAFVIDVALVWLVAGVVGWLIATGTDLSVRVPNVFETTQSRSVSVSAARRISDHLNDAAGDPLGVAIRRGAVFTRTDQWGLIRLYTVTLVREERDGNVTITRSATAAVDETGEPTIVLDFEALAWLLLALASAALLPRGGQTFGKRAAGIRVTRSSAIEPPTFGAALLREVVRLGPFIVTSLLAALALYGFDVLGPLDDTAVAYLGASGLTLLLFAPLIWSFVRWRGQAFHDRMAGLAVREA